MTIFRVGLESNVDWLPECQERGNAMLKSCKYCGHIHDSKYDCGSKPKRSKENTEQTRLRTCRKWNKTRKQVNDRDHFICRVCFARGVIHADGLETHHIVPLAEDDSLAYEEDNLITLCVEHHKAADKGLIARAELTALAGSELTI